MKKKQSRRERQIKKAAKRTARFFNMYGCLPRCLISGLASVRVSETILFNYELGKWSPLALKLLIHSDETFEASDESVSDLHPALEQIHGGMFQ
jgi:hypothetical protein